MVAFSRPVEYEKYGFPSSNHPGGVNVAFCGGNIKFVAEQLDSVIYGQLMTSNSRKSNLVSGGSSRSQAAAAVGRSVLIARAHDRGRRSIIPVRRAANPRGRKNPRSAGRFPRSGNGWPRSRSSHSISRMMPVRGSLRIPRLSTSTQSPISNPSCGDLLPKRAPHAQRDVAVVHEQVLAVGAVAAKHPLARDHRPRERHIIRMDPAFPSSGHQGK